MAAVTPNNQAVVPVREGSSISYQCPLLTATNYTSWAIKMESIMDAHGIWDAIEPSDEAARDAKIGKKAKAFIFQALPEDILLQVAGHKTAKEVWDALKTRYLGADRVQQARISTLNREFELLSMKETDNIDDFAGKIGEIVSKFRTLGSTLDEKAKVKKLLNSAPTRFLPIVATIEQYSDLNKMLFEELVGRLKAYEERLKPAEPIKDSAGQLLLTKSEWQIRQKQEPRQASRSRGNNRGRGRRHFTNNDHMAEQTDQRSRETNQEDQTERRDRRYLRCYNCDKIGHFSAECQAPSKSENEANFIIEDDEPTLLMAKAEAVMLNEKKVLPKVYADYECEDGMWFLDNGASNHMTGHRNYFSELDGKVTGHVKFGDGSTVEIKGKGCVTVKCKNGEKRVFSDVFYIPELHNNIMSLGQLDEQGCKATLGDGILKLYDQTDNLLMKIQRSKNRLYTIKLQVCLLSEANNSKAENEPVNFVDQQHNTSEPNVISAYEPTKSGLNIRPVVKNSNPIHVEVNTKTYDRPVQVEKAQTILFGSPEIKSPRSLIEGSVQDKKMETSEAPKQDMDGLNAQFREPIKQVCFKQLKQKNKRKRGMPKIGIKGVNVG